MHADSRGVDHLDSGIMASRKCVYDAAPETSLPPAYEAVVACGVRTKRLGQITPGCSGAQDPENAIEDTPVVHPEERHGACSAASARWQPIYNRRVRSA